MQDIKRYIILEKAKENFVSKEEKNDEIIFKAVPEVNMLTIFNLTRNKIICAWTTEIEEMLKILPEKVDATEKLWELIQEWMKKKEEQSDSSES